MTNEEILVLMCLQSDGSATALQLAAKMEQTRADIDAALSVLVSSGRVAVTKRGNWCSYDIPGAAVNLADAAIAVVEDQARDEGLWFVAPTASEAYLQAALRRLHAAIEAASGGCVTSTRPT